MMKQLSSSGAIACLLVSTITWLSATGFTAPVPVSTARVRLNLASTLTDRISASLRKPQDQEAEFELPYEKPVVVKGLKGLWKGPITGRYKFKYEYTELVNANAEVGVLLIPPIGVGLGRWYYDRLFAVLMSRPSSLANYTFLAPDLLGAASACNPVITDSSNGKIIETKQLPLFTIDDWSCQMLQLMQDYQAKHPNVKEWCILAKGGCVTIGLDMARQLVVAENRPKLRHLVLANPPRLFNLVQKSPDAERVKKTYYSRMLGLPGRFLWFSALRNLATSTESLGAQWRTLCAETARANNGRSKHSLFAFLAGSLKRNCQLYFNTLVGTPVQISIILPKDKIPDVTPLITFLKLRNLGGEYREVEGRKVLAYEDPTGFADALVDFIKR